MKAFIQSQYLVIIGVLVGALGGYLYWKNIGCATGTCMITSKPINSSLYGALMGFLVAGIFKKENKNI
jgi:H+/Cl- antiporter ClcA